MTSMPARPPLSRSDLDHVLDHTVDLWRDLRHARLFITGGTGFFGAWLAESFVWANERLSLGASASLLTRNPQAFGERAPHLAQNPALELHFGDVRTFEFPKGKFSHLIHAATETSVSHLPTGPAVLFASNLEGTKRILEFARESEVSRLLFTSSGAVYGVQPPEVTHLQENFTGAPSPLDLAAAYGNSKRGAEFLCVADANETKLKTTIARCFAFVGPHLPLSANYAIGNFIADCLNHRSIKIGGDGTPRRSYLYAADLAIWLWTILLRGNPGSAYNVGSEDEVSIAELAHEVAETLAPGTAVEIAIPARAGMLPARYVPSTARARTELGLESIVSRREGIRRTAEWYSSAAGH